MEGSQDLVDGVEQVTPDPVLLVSGLSQPNEVINEHIGGTEGCTHLRELLFNMATAAYQTLPAGQWQRRELAGQPHPEMTQAPYFLGQCHSWAYDSPTVQRAYPMFFRPKAV